MLFASNNEGKIKEVRTILKKDIQSLKDLNIDIKINENKKTLLENAILKAKEVYKQTKIPTIADDSGLEIDSLNGFPGVKTHRFLGLNKNDHERNQYILKKMENITNRTCYFTCCMAYYDGINLITSEYRLKGEIASEERINNGFGFDSIFLYNGKYLSDMTMEEKNMINPRKLALEKLMENNFFKKNIDLTN